MATHRFYKYVASNDLIEFLQWAVEMAKAATRAQQPNRVTQLHKLTVRLLTRNDHYSGLVDQRLFQSQKPSDEKQEITIAVLSPDDSSMPPPPCWGETTFHPREFEKQLQPTPFRATYFHDCRLWQIYDSSQKFGVQWMTGSRDYPPWETAAPLRVFLHWAYCFAGMRLAHAGSLGKECRGAILAGRGGAGKSGTVIGGIWHGLESVGDDYLLIDDHDGVLSAHPVYITLKQDRQGLARLGLESKIASERSGNWQNKFEFRSEDIAGASLAEQMELQAVLIPKITNKTNTEIRTVSRSQAMLALAATGLSQMPGERDSGVRFFADLIRRVPCYELALGIDPANVSKTLSTFLDGERKCA